MGKFVDDIGLVLVIYVLKARSSQPSTQHPPKHVMDAVLEAEDLFPTCARSIEPKASAYRESKAPDSVPLEESVSWWSRCTRDHRVSGRGTSLGLRDRHLVRAQSRGTIQRHRRSYRNMEAVRQRLLGIPYEYADIACCVQRMRSHPPTTGSTPWTRAPRIASATACQPLPLPTSRITRPESPPNASMTWSANFDSTCSL